MSDSQKPHKLSDMPAYDSIGGSTENSFGHTVSHGKPTLASKLAVITAIFAAIAILGAIMVSVFTQKTHIQDFVKTDQYQAVFLSNDQVYFGKITSINDRYLVLEDIFYLNVDQNLQDTDETSVSLTKLGSELHGPEDQMFIYTKDIIFWENLKDDSQVVQAIEQYHLDGSSNGSEAETGLETDSEESDDTVSDEDTEATETDDETVTSDQE